MEPEIKKILLSHLVRAIQLIEENERVENLLTDIIHLLRLLGVSREKTEESRKLFLLYVLLSQVRSVIGFVSSRFEDFIEEEAPEKIPKIKEMQQTARKISKKICLEGLRNFRDVLSEAENASYSDAIKILEDTVERMMVEVWETFGIEPIGR